MAIDQSGACGKQKMQVGHGWFVEIGQVDPISGGKALCRRFSWMGMVG